MPNLRDVYILGGEGEEGSGLDDLRAKFPGAIESLADEMAESGALEPGDEVFNEEEFIVDSSGRLRYKMQTDPPDEGGPPERVWDEGAKKWLVVRDPHRGKA